ncbi:unnamed protein product [Onchocerca ochengi]|uniref:MARVEL domain-containing protein n=1 Tax=Onchocerca ochengi TaxID=42157 RepID=A0A182E9U8_ONCOC|nr:unnamed protein product [Onchocerca ochengi]
MCNNPTCVQSNTTAITASVPTALPNYSNYVSYFINPINDRDIMSTYYDGANSSQNAAYRSYLQFDVSPVIYRRSRTEPIRTVPPKMYEMMYTKRNHTHAINPHFFDSREYRSYSGPWKDARKWPMYRKKKESSGRMQTYQESKFGSNPIDRQSRYYHGLYRVQLNMQPIALRRIRPYYAPSYATYPPSIMNIVRTTKYGKRYSIMMRIIVKVIELVGNFINFRLLGVATIGLILAPMREMSFYEFVKMTQTQWQSLVLGICISFSSLCLIMLFGICFAYRYLLWQKFDYLISLVGSFGYLFAGTIEAYYAACYPPNGEKIGLVCYRLEWIIASNNANLVGYGSQLKSKVENDNALHYHYDGTICATLEILL